MNEEKIIIGNNYGGYKLKIVLVINKFRRKREHYSMFVAILAV